MTNNPQISLNILSSHCWIDDHFSTHSKFSETFNNHADLAAIELKQIPPMKRRRLNSLSKVAMHSSLSCLQKAHIEADSMITVFASQHGELNRTISIINDLTHTEEISPKDFSLSVHNSSLGLFSIFNRNQLPGTSIAAGSNTFGFSLLESYNYLKRFPDSRVLLTCFDLTVDTPFDSLQDTIVPSYSLSLLLALNDSDQSRISFSFNKLDDNQEPDLPVALAFFEFIHSQSQHTVLNSQDTQWEFRKDVV